MTQNWPDLLTPTQPKQRVALLIDGDNIAADHMAALHDIAAQAGDPAIRRVYCDSSHLGQWSGAPGLRAIHSGAGKNATDMLLVIDAMALAYDGAADVFVIASSDRDFAHLAHHLREKGHRVIGVGEGKAPAVFRAACSDFRCLTAPLRDLEPIDQKVRGIILESGDAKGFAIERLNNLVKTRHGLSISTRPERNWRAYLTKRPTLYACEPRGPLARVRWIGG